MSTHPKVTVLMSVYNEQKYVSQAIESILSQTYTDFEFIIINDGSSDNSLKILRYFEKKDSRIKLISRPNKGLVASLNEGLLRARGDYIVRMDADDISVKDRIYKQVKFMEAHPNVGVCGTWMQVFGERIKQSTRKYSSNNEFLKTQLIFSPCFSHPSVIIRKSVLTKNNILYDEDYKYIEDYELWVRLSRLTDFSNLKEVLYKYRISEGNVTKIANKDVLHRFETSQKIFNNILKSLNMNNCEKENHIHFILALNDRIRDTKYTSRDLESYLHKIYSANQSSGLYNRQYLNKILGKRWLWVCYYRRDPKLFFSKFFFHGIKSLL